MEKQVNIPDRSQAWIIAPSPGHSPVLSRWELAPSGFIAPEMLNLLKNIKAFYRLLICPIIKQTSPWLQLYWIFSKMLPVGSMWVVSSMKRSVTTGIAETQKDIDNQNGLTNAKLNHVFWSSAMKSFSLPACPFSTAPPISSLWPLPWKQHWDPINTMTLLFFVGLYQGV